MITVPSPQLCVPLASGGDPTYAFNVKLAGEEVHGTSKKEFVAAVNFRGWEMMRFFCGYDWLLLSLQVVLSDTFFGKL